LLAGGAGEARRLSHCVGPTKVRPCAARF